MAMLSLSVSCIHLELSAAKSPKEQALVLSMILFQRGRKMTELCATRMELDYAFVEFPQLLRAGDRGTRPLQDHDAQAGRVHQAAPDACPALRIPPDKALRSASQRHQDRDHRADP